MVRGKYNYKERQEGNAQSTTWRPHERVSRSAVEDVGVKYAAAAVTLGGITEDARKGYVQAAHL
jgi:hypothetical protein